jgi:hypothetical protein
MHPDNDDRHPVSSPETYDSPTERVSINQLSVDELDAWLDKIRQRRLVTVQKLEAAAKVKSDQVRLTTFLKYERQMTVAKRALGKLDEQIVKVEAIVHKLRLLAMACELEVGEDEEELVNASEG